MTSCDVAVIGATPAGVVAATHAARAGRETCLVALNNRLGGMMASGLGMTDTLFGPEKSRSPLLDEFFERVRTHYREGYGEDSEQYRICNGGMFFEPHVAEAVFEALVDEPELTVRRERYPASTERTGSRIRSVTLESFDDDTAVQVESSVFVDATYEGDLAAVAGVPYRVGRESYDVYGERYAGRIFVDATDNASLRPGTTGEGDDAVQSYNYRLCLCRDPDNRRPPEKPEGYDRREYLWIVKPWEEMAATLDESGADGMEFGLRSRTSNALANAMARWVESDGPPRVGDENRWVPLNADPYRPVDPVETEQLPCPAQTSLLERAGTELAGLFLGDGDGFRWGELPNDKYDLNTCDLVGESDAYPEADWEEREEIAARHLGYVVGFLYFLRNDSAVPARLQERAREWGLAADEFGADNLPFQLYVREARRIEGRETFTEHDAVLAEGIDRALINETSVAIAEYPLDPHDVRPVRRTGTAADGRFFLTELTVPSQIPYGAIVPDSVDNLLVPVALSASHVGFQTIRLEPTWIHLGESAGIAASEALERDTDPRSLDVTRLQQRLAEAGYTLSFFTDFDSGSDEPWVPAMQFLATKGFFRGYEARPAADLDEKTATLWARTTATLLADGSTDSTDHSATDRARALPVMSCGGSVTPDAFADTVLHACESQLMTDVSMETIRTAVDDCNLTGNDVLSRGDACRIVYRLVTGVDVA